MLGYKNACRTEVKFTVTDGKGRSRTAPAGFMEQEDCGGKMADKIYEFSELLAELVGQANISGNQLEISYIKDFFADMELSAEQFNHVLAYLKASHIEIVGYDASEAVEREAESYRKAAKERLDDAVKEGQERKSGIKGKKSGKYKKFNSEYLNLYLEELKHIERMSEEEEVALIDRILKNDEKAEVEYLERKLCVVVEKAMDFNLSEDFLKELIEEGNIGLLTGIKELKKCPEEKEPVEFVEARIESAMQDFIEESLDFESSANAMVAKVNFVSDAAKAMKEKNGSSPTLKELASYTNLTEEELADIIELAADELTDE